MSLPSEEAVRRPDSVNRGLLCVAGAIVLLHAVQVFSPLRLNHDSVRLLAMAWSAHTTGSYDARGVADQYPAGYPAMVRALLATGLGRSFWLNALNFGWLMTSAAGCYWMARRQFHQSRDRAVIGTLLPLLSWVTIKHAAIPLSDIPYLGIAMLSLICLQSFWLTPERLSWPAWLASLLLALAAVQVRTIGITLVATVLLSLALHPCGFGLELDRRKLPNRRSLLVGLVAIGLFLGLLITMTRTVWFERQFLKPGSYFEQLLTHRGGATDGNTFGILRERLLEMTAVILNVPLRSPPLLAVLPVAIGGLAAMGWSAYRCRKTHLPLILYGTSMAMVLAVWPFADARFLLPLVPIGSLLVCAAAPEARSVGSWPRWLMRIYVGAFALLGIAALCFSLRLTFSGREMANRYSAGRFQLTYRHAFGLAPGASPEQMDADWLASLRHYEPRAR